MRSAYDLAIEKYKEADAELGDINKIQDLWATDYDPNAYPDNDYLTGLELYLNDLRQFVPKLREAAFYRQQHFDDFIKNKYQEDDGHNFWRHAMNLTVEHAEKVLARWEARRNQQWDQLIANQQAEIIEELPDFVFKYEYPDTKPIKDPKRKIYKKPKLSTAQIIQRTKQGIEQAKRDKAKDLQLIQEAKDLKDSTRRPKELMTPLYVDKLDIFEIPTKIINDVLTSPDWKNSELVGAKFESFWDLMHTYCRILLGVNDILSDDVRTEIDKRLSPAFFYIRTYIGDDSNRITTLEYIINALGYIDSKLSIIMGFTLFLIRHGFTAQQSKLLAEPTVKMYYLFWGAAIKPDDINFWITQLDLRVKDTMQRNYAFNTIYNSWYYKSASIMEESLMFEDDEKLKYTSQSKSTRDYFGPDPRNMTPLRRKLKKELDKMMVLNSDIADIWRTNYDEFMKRKRKFSK